MAAALAAAIVAGCDDGTTPPAAPGPATPAPPGAPPDLAKKLEADAKQGDEIARGLLKSAEARTYDPRRDGLVEAVEGGELVLRDGDKEARFAFSFDAAKPAAEAVGFEATSQPEGFDPALVDQARRWVHLACVGAHSFVAYHVPPTPLVLAPCKDEGSLLVLARPHRTPLNVSYVIEKKRQLVTDRGEWTDAEHRFVTKYAWEDRRGRQFLVRSTTLQGEKMDSGPVAAFEYDERDGPSMLRRVRVTDGARAYDGAITYKKLRRRDR